MKIKKGDIVKVITGKHRGKEGKVVLTMPRLDKIVVEGVNIVKKHEKITMNGQVKRGGIIEVEAPLHVSNVMLIDSKSGKTTRVGYKMDKDGKKKRFSKRSDNLID